MAAELPSFCLLLIRVSTYSLTPPEMITRVGKSEREKKPQPEKCNFCCFQISSNYLITI